MHGRKDGCYMCSVCDYSCKHQKVVRFHEQNHHNHIPFTVLFPDKTLVSDAAQCTDADVDDSAGSRQLKDDCALRCAMCPFVSSDPELLLKHSHEHQAESSEEVMGLPDKFRFLAGLSLLPKALVLH